MSILAALFVLTASQSTASLDYDSAIRCHGLLAYIETTQGGQAHPLIVSGIQDTREFAYTLGRERALAASEVDSALQRSTDGRRRLGEVQDDQQYAANTAGWAAEINDCIARIRASA